MLVEAIKAAIGSGRCRPSPRRLCAAWSLLVSARKARTPPKTICRARGERGADRGVLPFDVTYKGNTASGFNLKGDGDDEHVGNDTSSVARCACGPIHGFHTVHAFQTRADRLDHRTADFAKQRSQESERGSDVSNDQALAESAVSGTFCAGGCNRLGWRKDGDLHPRRDCRAPAKLALNARAQCIRRSGLAVRDECHARG